MHDAVLVRSVERSRRLSKPGEHALGRLGPVLPQYVVERAAAQILHDDVGTPFVLADVVDHHGVRLPGEPRRRERFSREPRPDRLVLGVRLGKDLDRHGTAENGVRRAVDLAHAPAADRLGPAVPRRKDVCVYSHSWSDNALAAPSLGRVPGAARRGFGVPSMRRLLALVLVLAATGAAPSAQARVLAPAGPNPTFVITGHGWGHGVGMSQYGAYGYAQHGFTYPKILVHYFPGTDLGTAAGKVRVLLSSGTRKLTLGSTDAFTVRDGSGAVHDVSAGTYTLSAVM